jgi:gliding motility-associated lipoprotein GldH
MSRKQKTTRRSLTFLALAAAGGFLLFAACGRDKTAELYHRFPDGIWARFNLLSFEMPVEKPGEYDISFFARFNREFQYDKLGFNMVMTTPSGEERINEYKLEVRSKSGDFCISCIGDSCEGGVSLKKGIRLDKPGILKIEIENLTPKMVTEGILGAGIRVNPSDK